MILYWIVGCLMGVYFMNQYTDENPYIGYMGRYVGSVLMVFFVTLVAWPVLFLAEVVKRVRGY